MRQQMVKTATYHCDGFRPINAGAEIGWRAIETAQDAVWVFGDRLAKRRYGRRGECAACRLNSYRQDKTGFYFEVFIGVRTPHGATSGRNEGLYVRVMR